MTVTTSRTETAQTPAGEALDERTAPLLPDADPDVPLRRFTVDEYHKIIEAGILDEDEHLELLDGLVVVARVGPMNEPHAYAVQELNRILTRQLGDEYRVRPQLPVTLGDRNEPEPDFAVVRTEDSRRGTGHPKQALIYIEVADSSLRKDRRLKAALYARFGTPEYVIVNIGQEIVEVHRDPDRSEDRYRTSLTLSRGDTFTSAVVPNLSFAVADLFT